MKIQRVIQRAAEIPKISVPDPDYPVETIAEEVRKRKLLQFDNSTAVLRNARYYSRISADECEAFLIALLAPEMQIAVSNAQIK